jgi:glutamate carboxypeptidase
LGFARQNLLHCRSSLSNGRANLCDGAIVKLVEKVRGHLLIARIAVCALLAAVAGDSVGAGVEPVLSLAQKEKPALLETLKELVAIESGSTDIEGLDRIAALIAARLKELGGNVEMIEPGPDIYKMTDTPEKIGKMVRATFTGTGTKKILLLAHMDTVYPRGTIAQQPFKSDGNRSYGLGIADDRHGIAVILHVLAILKTMKFRDYGTITVLINGDEEVSSPASRNLITKLGAEHDAVLSFESGGDPKLDQLRLATSGIALAVLTVRGRASHSGVAPELGVNALYELSHQILQARDLSEPKVGLKVNWTLASAGTVRNMIPPRAKAEADIRVDRISDYDGIEKKLRERIKNKLLPDAQVELEFERRRPPLQATNAARALAAHAQTIYAELGRQLEVREEPTGGGTDAAFAALKTKAPVIEGFGLRGFGAHSTDAEYILIDSIEPRLYLAARMIMDVARGNGIAAP